MAASGTGGGPSPPSDLEDSDADEENHRDFAAIFDGVESPSNLLENDSLLDDDVDSVAWVEALLRADIPPDPLSAEPVEDAGPEIRWLANHVLHRQSSGTTVHGPFEEMVRRILTALVPELRRRGFTGTTDEALIGAYNHHVRAGRIPIVPNVKASSGHSPAKNLSAGRKWKMKNRPKGMKYKKKQPKKKPQRKPGSKSVDVSADALLSPCSSLFLHHPFMQSAAK